MLTDWLVYIAIGRLMLFLWQQFPLPQFLEKRKTIKYLHECDLCSGVWIFGILSFFLRLDLLEALMFWHIPFVSELVTGGVISYLVHVFLIGWRARHEVIVV